MRIGNMEVTHKSGYIRFYKDGEEHGVHPPLCNMNFNEISPELVEIHGLMGTWSKGRFDQVAKYFKDRGFKTIIAYCPLKWKPKNFKLLVTVNASHVMMLDLEELDT